MEFLVVMASNHFSQFMLIAIVEYNEIIFKSSIKWRTGMSQKIGRGLFALSARK